MTYFNNDLLTPPHQAITTDDSATLRALITRAESASPPPSNLVGAKAKLAEINAEIDGAKPAPAAAPAEPSAAPAIAPLRVPRGQTADAFPSSPDAITTTDAPMTARTAEMVSPRERRPATPYVGVHPWTGHGLAWTDIFRYTIHSLSPTRRCHYHRTPGLQCPSRRWLYHASRCAIGLIS